VHASNDVVAIDEKVTADSRNSRPTTPARDPIAEYALEADICTHIFSVSAVMVGAVLTVIGLLQVLLAVKKVSTLADDVLAFASVLFLASCLAAYLAMRRRGRRRMHRLERFADTLFVIAMIMTVVSGLFVTYAFTAGT
jgi:hypothetical protein